MKTTQELREQVMAMESSDCRQELADTLEIIGQLEADMETLIWEVGTSSLGHSKDFKAMAERRGVSYRR